MPSLESGLERRRRARYRFGAPRRDGVAEAKVSAAPLAPAFNRVEFPLPAPEPVVSIIVPTRDRADLLGPCVDGILNRTDYSSIELLIVDNGTIAPDAMALIETLRNTPRVRVLRDDRPFNFFATNQ